MIFHNFWATLQFLPWSKLASKFHTTYSFPWLQSWLRVTRSPQAIIRTTVQLFNKLKWIPFFENAKLAKCCIIYKRLQGRVPSYLTNLLVLTGETHSRQTRYAKFNIACPRVNRNTEGGRTFTVTACREWNKLPLQMRKAETLKTFKNSLWNRIFKDQQSLNHFSI